jgi:hypothetical protein
VSSSTSADRDHACCRHFSESLSTRVVLVCRVCHTHTPFIRTRLDWARVGKEGGLALATELHEGQLVRSNNTDLASDFGSSDSARPRRRHTIEARQLYRNGQWRIVAAAAAAAATTRLLFRQQPRTNESGRKERRQMKSD